MSRQQLKVIISGGGTGGHIFPAIAIANALKRMDASVEIFFIGALGRMEMEKIPKAGYRIEGLPIAGMQRSFSPKNLALPFKVIESLIKARRMIRKFQPDAVVGVGGYASGPVLFAASMMKIPTLIQEQNSYAGLTNKILGRRVNKICVAYDGMEKFFPAHKIIVTGNPVRDDIASHRGASETGQELKRNEANKFFGLTRLKKVLLIIGGSLGAGTINETIIQNSERLARAEIQVIWQTGKWHYGKCAEAAKNFSELIKVYPFIDRMDLAYAAADVVISRSGALSIAELCIAKKACVLVPSPNVAEDHQTKNAMALVNKSAALWMKNSEAKEKLTDTVLNLMNNDSLMYSLRNNIAALAKPDADDDIAKEVFKLMKP